ncbi:MAG: FkbM family methyltransferase [Pseudomonadota bacterium]
MKKLALALYRALLRLYPLNAGLTPLSFNSVTDWMLSDLRGPVHASMRDGLVIETDPHDHDGRVLFLFGSCDFKVTTAVTSMLSEGDVLLDIGANHGTIGLAARHSVGGTGEVHLFEPQPHLADILETAVASAGVERVFVHRLALFDRDDELTMHRAPQHSGRGTLIDRTDAPEFDTMITVTARETGPYLADLLRGRRFGAKLDVEGAEAAVLPGLFAQPNLAFCVFEGVGQQADLFALFTQQGFVIYGLNRHPVRFGLTRIDRVADMKRFHDFAAVPRDQIEGGGKTAVGRAIARYAR